MKFSIISDELTPIERTLRIRVDAESVKEIWDAEVTKLSGQVTLPGFRPGKAPQHLIERQIGHKRIWENVRNIAANGALKSVLKETEAQPLIPPDVSFDTINDNTDEDKGLWKPGQDLEFTATYFLPPPSPEDIERDLQRRAQGNVDEHRINDAFNPGTTSTSPPDPRSLIPGSGANVDKLNSLDTFDGKDIDDKINEM